MRPGLWGYFRPGCLASLALVLIVGGCLAISSSGGGSSTGSSSGYGASGSSGGAAGAPVTGAAQPPPPNTPTWTGLLRVTTSGVDMSKQPPTQAQGRYENTTVAYSPSDQTLYTGEGPSAIWTSPTDPTYEQCLTQVQTQALSGSEQQAIPYRPGQGLCTVAYEHKAMAFVRGNNPPTSQAVEMRGIRWQITQ